VVDYDAYTRTSFEILIMKKAKGTLWMNTIVQQSPEERKEIFRQTMQCLKEIFSITFEDFGEPYGTSYSNIGDLLLEYFYHHLKKIKEHLVWNEENMKKIKTFIEEHLYLFEEDESVLVHNDIHMGNIIHDGDKLVAIIDFDGASKGVPLQCFVSVFGLIFNPKQFVEGTEYFERYQSRKFLELFNILVEVFPEYFGDQTIEKTIEKMNVLFILENTFWISDGWGEELNRKLTTDILERLVEKDILMKKFWENFS